MRLSWRRPFFEVELRLSLELFDVLAEPVQSSFPQLTSGERFDRRPNER